MMGLKLKKFTYYEDGNERALGVTFDHAGLNKFRNAVSFGWSASPRKVAENLRILADWCEGLNGKEEI